MEIVKKNAVVKDFDNIKQVSDYVNLLDDDITALFSLSQSRIRFGAGTDGSRGENISGEWQVVADTGGADTEFAVAHTIGSVPIGFIVTNIDKGAVIYDSGTAWTSSNIYLKSTVANSAVTLFLIK